MPGTMPGPCIGGPTGAGMTTLFIPFLPDFLCCIVTAPPCHMRNERLEKRNEHGRLAAPAGADECEYLTFGHVEGDAVHSDQVAESFGKTVSG